MPPFVFGVLYPVWAVNRTSGRRVTAGSFMAKLPRTSGKIADLVSCRHCGERSEAIQLSFLLIDGLLRFARNDGPGLFEI